MKRRAPRWAGRAVAAADLPVALADRVADLVLATKHTASEKAEARADARLIVDVDLSILGRSPERFDRYERQIRQEYRFVPWFLYRKRRAEILRSFLDRPAIFWTRPFRDRYEDQARANIERSLAKLT